MTHWARWFLACIGNIMRHLDNYTPDICSQLRHIAERRDWRAWDNPIQRDEVLEDLELTYHLHLAAEAAGVRAGLPAMSEFPIGFFDSEGILDPSAFIHTFNARHSPPRIMNQSDNNPRAGLAATA